MGAPCSTLPLPQWHRSAMTWSSSVLATGSRPAAPASGTHTRDVGRWEAWKRHCLTARCMGLRGLCFCQLTFHYCLVAC